MYNHRKVKSSFFLIDNPYPERILSRHKYYRKSGFYFHLKSRLFPVYSLTSKNVGHTPDKVGSLGSKLLLKQIPNFYLDKSPDKESQFLFAKGNAQANSLEEGRITSTHLQFAEIGGSFENNVKESLSPTKKKGNKKSERGLLKVENSSFTNGLLKCGHRYFCISHQS